MVNGIYKNVHALCEVCSTAMGSVGMKVSLVLTRLGLEQHFFERQNLIVNIYALIRIIRQFYTNLHGHRDMLVAYLHQYARTKYSLKSE